MTSTPFDPMELASVLNDRNVQCPKCCRVVVARQRHYSGILILPLKSDLCNIPYTALHNLDGTGYAQKDFAFTCECGFKITRNKLGTFKFVRDLVKDNSGADLTSHLVCDKFTSHWADSLMQVLWH
jgi:hypothetical protein